MMFCLFILYVNTVSAFSFTRSDIFFNQIIHGFCSINSKGGCNMANLVGSVAMSTTSGILTEGTSCVGFRYWSSSRIGSLFTCRKLWVLNLYSADVCNGWKLYARDVPVIVNQIKLILSGSLHELLYSVGNDSSAKLLIWWEAFVFELPLQYWRLLLQLVVFNQ